jgi:hypothetical protein
MLKREKAVRMLGKLVPNKLLEPCFWLNELFFARYEAYEKTWECLEDARELMMGERIDGKPFKYPKY